MTLFQVVGAGWLAVTLAVIGLMIHRAILSFREDDQFFLTQAETGMQEKQVEVSTRMTRLTHRIHQLATASVVMLVFMIGVGAYQVLLEP